MSQRGLTAKSPKRVKKIDPEPPIEFGSFIGDKQITLILPIRTVSEANCSEGWKRKHARHRKQKNDMHIALSPVVDRIKLPCRVRITRHAPRKLDKHDNLPYSQKWVYDSICDSLIPGLKAGRADDDDRISVEYDQVKTSKIYYIEVRFTWSD